MNSLPLVSILVPVYNVEQYIERCARSVFEQTYENLEYIFLDDCTPDNSIAIIEQVLAEYPDRASAVRIIKHNQNEGIAITRNNAIRNATGDFIFFVDSDDYIETDTISALVNEQNLTKADIVSGKMLINENGMDSRYVEPIYKDKDELMITVLSNLWHHEIYNRLVRRTLFVDNDIKAIPHVNICEDWQLTAKVVYFADKCVTLDKFTYHYMINPNSLVHSNTEWDKEKKAYIQESLALENLIDFFKGTQYERFICSFFVRRCSDLIDLGIKHHDKEFYNWCRAHILSVQSMYHKYISRKKLICIKSGYYATCFFLFLHQLKHAINPVVISATSFE